MASNGDDGGEHAEVEEDGAGDETGADSDPLYWGGGIAVGLAVGVAIGVAMDDLAVGVAIGLALGAAFGAIQTHRD